MGQKIVISQTANQFFCVGGNMVWNVSKIEIDGAEMYSVGAEHISLGLYRKPKHAMAALKAVADFIIDDTRKSLQLEADVAKK